MKKKPVIKTAFIRDPEEREDYEFNYETEEQLLKHLGDHPHHWIKEIYVPEPYVPYTPAQFFAYIIIGGVIGFWIGLGLFYLGEWLLS